MPSHDFAIVQVRRRQRRDDPALVHDVAALRHGTDHVEILLDENDGSIGSSIQIDNGTGDVLHDRRLNSFGRLVEKKQRGLADEHPSDRELLLLAA
jgi:hypothetical protein